MVIRRSLDMKHIEDAIGAFAFLLILSTAIEYIGSV